MPFLGADGGHRGGFSDVNTTLSSFFPKNVLDKVLFSNESYPLTRHADTSEGPRIVETGAIVPTGVALALIDVSLTAGSGEPDRTVAGERPWGVHANTVVFTWRSCGRRREFCKW